MAALFTNTSIFLNFLMEKLTNLSQNIITGNALIDDKNVYSNCFIWKTVFPEVTVSGGFDVVIGNPPWLGLNNMKNEE